MKYNLKKLKDGKIIKFIVKGTTLRDAIFELDICFASEKCDAFQDVDDFVTFLDSNCHYFECIKNGSVIRYEIEVDSFQQFEIFRPAKLFKPKNEETYHFNLN